MDREALVVGINLYPLLRDGRTKKPRHLDKPAADAEAVAQILETYGQFRVRRLPEVYDQDGNPHVAAKPHPTQLVRVKTLQEAIANLFNPPSRQVPDTALLFFAGHGLRNDQGGVSEGFLATSDVKPQDGKWGVSLQWLRRLLQESPVRQQIVWLDCCHSGELLNFLEADPGALGEARDRCFIAASRDFEVAYEEFGGQHGVLTGALLPGLRPEGKSQGWVTNYSLVEAINRQLLTSRQRPIFHNSGGEILLTGRKETIERAVLMAEVCPYKGLESFEFNDHDPKYFYGRTALTDQVLAKIRQGNFLAVVGASGSGKSSLVKAGLLYQLKLGQRLSGSSEWAIRIFRPGEHPLKSLALALVDEAAESGEVEQLASQGAAGLAEWVGAIDAPRVVLVVDQFEEVFTLCQDDREREQFFECLLGVTSPLTPPLQGEGNMAAVDPLNNVDHVGAQGLRPNRGLNRRPNQPLTSDQKLPDHQQGQDLESTSPLAPPLQGEGNIAPPSYPSGSLLQGEGNIAPPSYPSGSLLQGEENIAPPSLAGKGAGGLGLRLNLTVVITMRADFFGKCAEQDYGGLANRIQENLVTITPMKTEELAAAITEPAKQVGLEIERELVTQMLHDVEGPGSLPLLQYTLTELWRQRQMNRLTLADYTKLGGVKGTLQKRADQVYESLSKDQQLIAKRIFLELTQLGEGTEDTRRQVFKQEFINDELSKELVEQVITELADARLLVTSQLRVRGESGATLTVVDVAHEALIRHWTRLRQWLNENREAMRKERKLEEAANEWESQGKPEERAFLLEGPKLLEAESFLEEYAHLGLLSNVAQEFIRVSQAYQERLRQQEEERQRREQQQTRRTIQVGIVSLIFVTGLAVAATGFALESRKQLKLASARELATKAEWIRSQRPDLHQTSVLLAVESMGRFQTLAELSIEADRALREGLRLLPVTVSQVSHESWLTDVAFSPDGQYLATASGDNTACISQVQTGKEVTCIKHESWVTDVAFSPDSQYLATASDATASGATASDDTTARISQVSTGKEVAHINHEDSVKAVVFSPDGQYLATASRDNTARISQVTTGKEVARINHEYSVNAVAFSPDGQYLATASGDKTVRISQVKTGKEVALIRHENAVKAVVFSPDGQFVATSSDNTARIFQVKTGDEAVPPIRHEYSVNAVVFSPDGQYLATASDDNTARISQVTTGKEVARISHEDEDEVNTLADEVNAVADEVNAVVFSPDSQYLATASSDNTARISQVTTGKEVARISHEDEVKAVAFSPDGQYLATASLDNTARISQVSTGTEVIRINNESSVEAVAFSRDGQYLTTSNYHNARMSQVQTGQNVARIRHEHRVINSQLTSDGQLMATSNSDDNTVSIWEVKTGDEVTRIFHKSTVHRLALSPDGQFLATKSAYDPLRVWDVNTGQKVADIGYIPWHPLGFSPDGQFLAMDSDRTVSIWEVKTGNELVRIPQESSVHALAFSPDGQFLATANVKNASIWEVKTGNEVIPPISHEEPVLAVAFSWDGQFLATASVDKTARISQVQTGKEVARIRHEHGVTAVAFSRDGQFLATGNDDNTVAVHWRDPQHLVPEACRRLSRNLTAGEWQTYMGQLDEYRKTCSNHPIHPSVLTSLLRKAKKLIRQGNEKEALAIIHRAKFFDPEIDLNPDTEAIDQDPKTVLQQFSALAKVEEGEELARAGKVPEAINAYTQALKLDPDLDLVPSTTDDKEKEPKAVAHAFAAKSKAQEGNRLAEDGKVQEAINSYTQALKLDPDLDLNSFYIISHKLLLSSAPDLNSDRGAKENDPKVIAHKFAAIGKFREGYSLAKQRKIQQAINSYTQAQKLEPTLKISAVSWNSLCWLGSLHQQATQGMKACEKAVTLEPEDGNIRDNRGLARALTGDTAGAIEDFQAYIEWTGDDEDIAQRQRWINELRAGKNPFTPEELERLSNE